MIIKNYTPQEVNIVLENGEKRSFFSILSPRIVKVQLTVKEEKNNKIKKEKK